MRPPSTYDKYPTISISSSSAGCMVGWERLLEHLGSVKPRLLCVECYPGVCVEEVEGAISAALQPAQVFRSSESMKPASELDCVLSPILGDDPVFGRMNDMGIEDFMDPGKLTLARDQIRGSPGLTLVIGTGAYLLARHADALVDADLAVGRSSSDSGEMKFPTWAPTTSTNKPRSNTSAPSSSTGALPTG